MRAVAAALAMMLLASPSFAAKKIAPPADGIYHCAHPDFGLRDDLVTKGRVRAFVSAAERPIVWAYFSWHWDRGIEFPSKQCDLLNSMGVVPLVGIMPWSERKQNAPEPVYTLERIARGYFDDEIAASARSAAGLGYPIMIEFGPEMNGPWFPWSPAHNGRDEDAIGDSGVPDGAERFRAAYRRVVEIFKREGATDVTWVFHTSAIATDAKWNDIRHAYPGDDCVDWLGASVYGRLRGDDEPAPFAEAFRAEYEALAALSPNKPIAVLEIGVSESSSRADKAEWITYAYGELARGAFPRVRAVAWWNKPFRDDGTRSMLEINSSESSLAAYRDAVSTFDIIRRVVEE